MKIFKIRSFAYLAGLLFMGFLAVLSCDQTANTSEGETSATKIDVESLVSDLEGAWNNQDLALVEKHYHSDFKRISPNGTVDGMEAWKQELKAIWNTWSDINLDIRETWPDENVVTMVWTWKATNTGPLDENIPATGKTISIDGMSKITYKDGKIMEDRLFWDRLAANEQLGFTMVPPQPLASDDMTDQ